MDIGFKFLIGRLDTGFEAGKKGRPVSFQFLIGRLDTLTLMNILVS